MEKPVRVLHMIGSLGIGGSQMMMINLHRSINRELVQFDYVITRDDDEAKTQVPVVERLGAHVFVLPNFNGKNIAEVKNAWNDFFQMHPEYRILHSHVRSYASIYIPIAHKYGLKTIIHSHSTSNGKGISALVKRILQYPLRFQADYFIACSKEAGEWLFGTRITNNTQKYHMLQNAIDISKYRCDPNRRLELRKTLGVEGKTVYIHIGRLHPSKNHSFLIDVFNEISRENNDAVLLIVGDGELRPQIEQRIRERGIEDRVIMLGARSDVPELLMGSDCFLFPSLWEGLPVTVVEAQASGLPCLVSDHVTNDVFVSELAIKLPIDKGVEIWSKKIQSMSLGRKDVEASIRDAGFDISETANWIQKLYLTMADLGES